MNDSFSDHHHALIQVATGSAGEPKHTVPCTVNAIQGKRLTVHSSEPVQISGAVSVEYEDALFLGEVVTCSDANGKWDIEIKVQQVLTGLQSLMILRERLLGEGVPQQVGMLPIGAVR